MKKDTVKKTVITSLCMALCYILPFITGQVPQINDIFSPMHVPILLCGIVCGPFYALVAGAVSPIFRSAVLTLPPMFPTAISMAFELAAYGFFSGAIYKILTKKSNLKEISIIYISLISAMILGRGVWGIVTAILLSVQGNDFTFATFFTTVFVKGFLGIICHLIIIPLAIFALKKAKIIK